MASALAAARDAVASGSARDDDFIVVAGDWPVGVIGLVAGRLAEEHGRPALVLSTQVEPWRGSARNAGAFDLARAFDGCADLLERHGGHPAAAGCHIAPGSVAALRERLAGMAAGLPQRDRRPGLTLDLVQSANAADHVLLGELAALDDAAEASPLVGFAGLIVVRARLTAGGHTQITLRKGLDVIDGIGFGRADLAGLLVEGQAVDIAAHLGRRTFGGLETIQLEVRDVAPAGHLAGMRMGASSPEGQTARAATMVAPQDIGVAAAP
jgi:single-stranded-DNA-specific exonuclease